MPVECHMTKQYTYTIARKFNFANQDDIKSHHHENYKNTTVSIFLAAKQQGTNIMIKCDTRELNRQIPPF